MKNLLYFLLSFSVFIIACKQNTGNVDSDSKEYNPAPPEADSLLYDKEQFMVPTPEGVYVPPGLRKMSVVEMAKWGKNGNDIFKVELSDQNGNPMKIDSFFNSDKKLFMQMYADDSGRVAKTIVFEFTDDIIKKLKEGK